MAKVATAVLEIRTDTGQVKGDLGALEQVGKKVGQTFQQQANVMSKGFSDFGSHVRQVQSLVNGFSGQKAIQEAHAVAKAVQEIGGAQKLTAEQQRSVSAVMSAALQAHKVRGDEASASIRNLAAETSKGSTATQGFTSWIGKANGMLAAFGVGLSAAAAIGFGKKMLADAAAIEDLHETVKISRTELQQLGFVGSEVGLDMQELGLGIGNLMDRIASGDQKTSAAIGMIGKSVKDLQAAGPLEAFLQVAEGADRIEDPMVKAALVSDAFGDKIGKKLIPLLGDLRKKMDDVPKDALISDQDIEDADRLGDAIGHLTTKLEALAFRGLRAVKDNLPTLNPGPTIQRQIDQMSTLQRLNLLGPSGIPQGKDIGLAPSTVKASLSMTDMLQNRLTQLRTQAMEPLSAMQKQWIADLQKWGESEGEIARLVKASETSVHLYTEELKKGQEATKKQAEEAKKLAAAIDDVVSHANRWYQVVLTVDGAVVEGAKYYIERGASLEKVAQMYALTEGQIEAINESMKFERQMVDATGQSYAGLTARLEAAAKAEREFGNRGFASNLNATITATKAAASTLLKVEEDSFSQRRILIRQHADEQRAALDATKGNFSDAMAAIEAAESASMDEVDRDYTATLRKMASETQSFSTMATGWLVKIPGTMQRAFEGGGGASGAVKSIFSGIGADIGSDAFGRVAGRLSQTFATKFGVKTTELLGTIIPGLGGVIGSLLGPVMTKAWDGLKDLFGGPSKKEREGRQVVADFEKQFANTTDMIQKVGAAYIANGRSADEARAAVERLWAAEKRGAAETKAALEEINQVLQRHNEIADAIHAQGFQSQDEIMHAADIANAAYEEMLRSGQYTQAQVEQAYRHYQELLAQLEGAAGEAARAWLKAHQAADDSVTASSDAMASAESDLKALIDQRDDLTKSIAAEAPEEMMGVIEQQQRQQRDALDVQIQKQADAYAQLAKDTGQEMAKAIREALERLHVTIDVGYDLHPDSPPPPAPTKPSGGEPTSPQIGPAYDDIYGGWAPDRELLLAGFPMAKGGYFPRVSQPTPVVFGEAGPEDAIFGGAGRSVAQDIATALAPMLGSDRGSIPPINITVVSTIDGREVARSYHRVLDHNPDGMRTEAQELLGVR